LCECANYRLEIYSINRVSIDLELFQTILQFLFNLQKNFFLKSNSEILHIKVKDKRKFNKIYQVTSSRIPILCFNSDNLVQINDNLCNESSHQKFKSHQEILKLLLSIQINTKT